MGAVDGIVGGDVHIYLEPRIGPQEWRYSMDVRIYWVAMPQ
ncbi:MAG: hypothetical protein O3B24_02435 [Verrucomicrobia bacterium]|nr:hypothetical protein [Verrucomicrobiota bacterium]